MRAAFLDGALWLHISPAEPRLHDGQAPKAADHIVLLREVQHVAEQFGEDIPTLLTDALQADAHSAWRALTTPQRLHVN